MSVCLSVSVCVSFSISVCELLTEVTLGIFLHSGDWTVLVGEEELLELGHLILQHSHLVLKHNRHLDYH